MRRLKTCRVALGEMQTCFTALADGWMHHMGSCSCSSLCIRQNDVHGQLETPRQGSLRLRDLSLWVLTISERNC